MRLPTPLLRLNSKAHKNQFGHILILAGSPTMLGAAALSSLSALRSGCGLVTLGIPKSLNLTAQKKISHAVMTLPLPQTKQQTIALSAFQSVKKLYPKFQAIAIGPGLSDNPSTQKFIQSIVKTCPVPLVIDADGLNAIADDLKVLRSTKTPKILTPHPGEMARLIHKPKSYVEKNRRIIALTFAQKHNCVLLLKGKDTVVASASGQVYINKTGNVGMATAGSGDVLTGMISGLLAQGIEPFEAAKWGAYLHGKAGDLAVQDKTKVSLIATDILDKIPQTLKTQEKVK